MDGKKRVFPDDDAGLLGHMADSLDEAMYGLKESYAKGDHESFNKAKKFMISLQKKISETIG